MIKFTHINGDTGPVYEFRLRKGNKPFVLTGATVTFRAKLSDNTIVTKTATITDATGGRCTVAFAGADLDVDGYAHGELVVAVGGVSQHGQFPVEFYIRPEYGAVPWQ